MPTKPLVVIPSHYACVNSRQMLLTLSDTDVDVLPPHAPPPPPLPDSWGVGTMKSLTCVLIH